MKEPWLAFGAGRRRLHEPHHGTSAFVPWYLGTLLLEAIAASLPQWIEVHAKERGAYSSSVVVGYTAVASPPPVTDAAKPSGVPETETALAEPAIAAAPAARRVLETMLAVRVDKDERLIRMVDVCREAG